MKISKILLLITAVLVILASTGCGPQEEATPTLDPIDIMTQVAMTVQAEVTQAALLTPSPTATLPPTATPPPAPTQPLPAIPTSAAGAGTAPTLPADSPDNATFVKDITVKDGTVYWKGETFTKTWRIENSGTTTWDTNYKLIYLDGALLTENTVVSIQELVEPGNQLDISVPMKAPDTLGTYTSYWRMMNGDGQFFGDVLYLEIKVGTEWDKTPTSIPG